MDIGEKAIDSLAESIREVRGDLRETTGKVNEMCVSLAVIASRLEKAGVLHTPPCRECERCCQRLDALEHDRAESKRTQKAVVMGIFQKLLPWILVAGLVAYEAGWRPN